MKKYTVKNNEIVEMLSKCMSIGEPCFIWADGVDPIVWNNRDDEVNMEYCKQNGITIAPIHIGGSTIYSNKTDIGCVLFTTNAQRWIDWCSAVGEAIITFLARRNIKAYPTGNDLVINGKKFVGYAYKKYKENGVFGALFVAIKDSSNIVPNVTTKKIIKEPTGLENYGITRKDIVDIINKVTSSMEEKLNSYDAP